MSFSSDVDISFLPPNPTIADYNVEISLIRTMMQMNDPSEPTYQQKKAASEAQIAQYQEAMHRLAEEELTLYNQGIAFGGDGTNDFNEAGDFAYPDLPASPPDNGTASSRSSFLDSNSAASSPMGFANRKRSLVDIEYPDSKRVSKNPSPTETPGTPGSSITFPGAYGEPSQPSTNHQHSRGTNQGSNQDFPVRSRYPVGLHPHPNNYASYFPSGPGSPMDLTTPKSDPSNSNTRANFTDIVDLTGDDLDDEPVPNTTPMFSNWTDPFPETDAAYRGGSNDIFRAGPADAFAQEWMSPMELAQFLVTPTCQADILVNGNRPGRPAEFGRQVAPQPSIAPYLDLRPAVGGPAQELFCMDEVDDSGVPRSEAITKLLENIQPDDEIPKERREQTPKAMCSSLMEHQKLGLSWLKKMEESASKGGILADDMGLGKTVQALALILARPSDDPICKTTLIIAPVALMRQWEKEIQRHVHPSMRLKVYIYHQGGKKADFNHLRQHDVVLTTFGCLSTEEKRIESFEESSRDLNEQNTGTRRKARDRLSLIGPGCYWYRVILDEAQCIKNKGTLTAKGAFRIRARHRLCMTGTPMMNSIDELYPQIRFLGIKPYNDWARFRTDISQQLKAGQDWRRERGVTRVHALIKSIMLRRTKQTILDGEPICNIPPKSIEPASVEFSDEEHELYKAIEGKSQLQFNKYLKAGTVVNNYASVLLLLLRLRQACCHPHLIKDLGVQVSTEGIDEEELLDRARQLKDVVVARLKESMGFECPICFDATQNPTIFMPCGHTSCGECFQKLIDPARALQEGREDGSAAKCPHCRGVLSANKITDYEHFCKVFCPDKLPDKLVISQANSEEDSESDSDEEEDEGEGDDLGGFVVPDDVEEDDDYFDTPAPKAEDGEEKKDKKACKGKGKGKKRIKEKKTLAQLKKESLRNKAAKKKYLRRLRKDWEPSAKIEKTLQLLHEIHENDPTEKTLVFSQFTSLLDLLEVPLQDRNVKYQRYDGSMKPDDRAAAVNDFMDRPDQKVMLISLKAGNAGLNLSKANHVIVLDPFWNPFIEDQAVDRAHRMPQQREVHVHRLLVPETVEDRIVTLQEQKREVISAALDENVGKSISRLGVAELKYLFGL